MRFEGFSVRSLESDVLNRFNFLTSITWRCHGKSLISTRAKCQYLHKKMKSPITSLCSRVEFSWQLSALAHAALRLHRLLLATIVRSSRNVYIRQADWRKTVKTHKTQDSATQLCYAMWMNTFYCFYLKIKTVEHSVVCWLWKRLECLYLKFFSCLFTSSAHFQHLRAAASDDDERDNDSVGVEAWWNGRWSNCNAWDMKTCLYVHLISNL